jgi:hypothetical protein
MVLVRSGANPLLGEDHEATQHEEFLSSGIAVWAAAGGLW